MKKEFLTIPVDELIPYENNPRNNDEAVDDVAESMEQCGDLDPIEVDENNVILSGHTRLKAMLQRGQKVADVIRYTGLTEEQKKKYRLLANKTGEKAGWDFEKLEEELKHLDFNGFDFGFDLSTEDEHFDIEEDEIPEEAPTRCKKGEIWQLGDHRLMCGDSTNKDDVEKLAGGGSIDLLLTDPPYGISIVGSGGKMRKGKVGGDSPVTVGHVHGNAKNAIIQQCNLYMPVAGDDSTETAEKSFSVTEPITTNQIIFGGNYFTEFLKPSRCWIVWDKQNSGSFADAELAWTSFDKVVKLYHFMWNGLCREGSREIEGKSRVHPTQKPVGLMANILQDFTEEGQTVLDVFGGSGSTLIACEQTKRKCLMMELVPHYCDVIIERWENLTGKKAQKIG